MVVQDVHSAQLWLVVKQALWASSNEHEHVSEGVITRYKRHPRAGAGVRLRSSKVLAFKAIVCVLGAHTHAAGAAVVARSAVAVEFRLDRSPDAAKKPVIG